MFSESLLDYSAGRARRSWSTLAAWTLQSCLIVLAVVLPLWQTNALPRLEVFRPIGAPPGAPPPKTPQPVHDLAPVRVTPIVDAEGLHAPVRIPKTIDRSADPVRDAGPSEAECLVCVPGAPPGPGGPIGVLNNIIARQPEVAPAPPKPITRVKVSDLSPGFLLHQVQPTYPAIARAARVEGTVVLAAVISRDGTIENLHVIGGPAMLINAAMDAVKQWRYRPYLLSGQPVEVETQISVVFTLAH